MSLLNKRRFLSTFDSFLMLGHDFFGSKLLEDDIEQAHPEMGKKAAQSVRAFLMAERERLQVMTAVERSFGGEDGFMVAGTDEAGRGPMAGPLVAAAVVFRKIPFIPCINDSKLLQREDREILNMLIRRTASSYAVVTVTPEEIDGMNIHRASLEAMSRALTTLSLQPGHALVDGAFAVPGLKCPQRAVKSGDRRCFTIACASILAKTTRDAIMEEYDSIYPEYGFGSHKGYCTKEHVDAIRSLGILPIHRRTYEPVKECIAEAAGLKTEKKQKAERRKHIDRGRSGEERAAGHLSGIGYEIVEMNYRIRPGEIDIIARHQGDIVFVEVKTRKSGGYGAPEEAVDRRKQSRLRSLASAWLSSKGLSDAPCRFDVVSLTLDGDKIEVIKNAF